MAIRVATLNLWCRHGDWPARRAVLRAGFAELRADLVAFQESVLTDGYDQVADLLGPGYHVVHQGGRGPDGSGSSIASRWPLGQLRELVFDIEPRIHPEWIGSVAAVGVDAPEPVGRLLFVHHKPTFEYGFELQRERHAVAAARFVAQVRTERHVVLAGDFDATPDSASVRFWRGRQSLDGLSVCYADAWESVHAGAVGHTFTPENPLVRGGDMPRERGRRIDYIMVRCDPYGPTLDVTACERIFDTPVDGVWASDHFGVVADLAAPAPPS